MTKRSKVIVACLLNITILSFSLIMFLSSPTISWYISKTKDQTEFMNIGVKDCYDFEININKSKLLYWDVNNNCAVLEEGEIDNLTLNSYDTFITTRNVHNARYVCLELEFLKMPKIKKTILQEVKQKNLLYIVKQSVKSDLAISNNLLPKILLQQVVAECW